MPMLALLILKGGEGVVAWEYVVNILSLSIDVLWEVLIMDKLSSVFQKLTGTFVPAAVLVWALGVLSASYMGWTKHIDAAFISSLVTSVLATYGISRKDEKEKEKKEPGYTEEKDKEGNG